MTTQTYPEYLRNIALATRWFSGGCDSCNSLQIACKSNVRPACQPTPHGFGNRPADLEYQPATGPQHRLRLRNESLADFQAGWSREHRLPRLELPGFRVHPV